MDELKQKYFSNNSSYYEDLFRKGISNTSINKLEDLNEKPLINMENVDQQQDMVRHPEDSDYYSDGSKENYLQGGQKKNPKKNAEATCKIKQKGAETSKVRGKRKKKMNRTRKPKPKKYKNTIFD